MKLKTMTWIWVLFILMIVFWRFALIGIIALVAMLALTGGADFIEKFSRAISAFQAEVQKDTPPEED